MRCQATVHQRVIQLQAVLTRGRRRWRCHEARRIHGRERLFPRNGLVHSNKLTKPCVILPSSICSRSLRLSDNEPEVRQLVLHSTRLPFCYDCNVCGEALYPRGQLRHLPCPSAHCLSQRRALLPTHLDVIRQQICHVHEFQHLDFLYQLCWHGSERFTKKEWTFLLASGRGDIGRFLRLLLCVHFPLFKHGHMLQRHCWWYHTIAGGITPRLVSLTAHQELNNRGTECTIHSVSMQGHFLEVAPQAKINTVPSLY